jgi:pheromone shutdown protein TraB
MKHDATFTLELMIRWFLINGTLSAIGAAIAMAHPATILSAFLAAPFTSLNPTIAAGWVAGLVELKFRKPRVKDFQDLARLSGLRDYLGNRITKVVLIIILANIGSSIGTFVALPYLAALL